MYSSNEKNKPPLVDRQTGIARFIAFHSFLFLLLDAAGLHISPPPTTPLFSSLLTELLAGHFWWNQSRDFVKRVFSRSRCIFLGFPFFSLFNNLISAVETIATQAQPPTVVCQRSTRSISFYISTSSSHYLSLFQVFLSLVFFFSHSLCVPLCSFKVFYGAFTLFPTLLKLAEKPRYVSWMYEDLFQQDFKREAEKEKKKKKM